MERSSGVSPNIEHELMACEHALAEALGEVDVTRAALDEVTAERDRLREAIDYALHELGVTQPGYPAPVANAIAHLNAAVATLAGGRG